MILRQQLGIAERRLHKPVRVSRVERLTLAVLTTKLKSSTNCTVEQLRRSIRIFQPKTGLGWHRQLVKRKWTYKQGRRPGWPRTPPEVEELILKMARQTPRAGPRQDRRRVAQAGIHCRNFNHPVDSPSSWHPTSTRPKRLILANISQSLQRPDARLQLLHGRNGDVANTLRVLLHRSRYSSGSHRRLHIQSRRRLGCSTGQELGLAFARS